MPSRQQQLHDAYGFDFPDDFFRFWDFVSRLRPLEPLTALADILNLHLVGPFEVLAGRFDGRRLHYSMYLHWRYYNDPPEFFTVLAGHTDGLHWGHYLDNPATKKGCVASYYARDAFELSGDGDTLFEAIRMTLEESYRDALEYREDDAAHASDYDAHLRELDLLRSTLCRWETGERAETGEEYAGKYLGRTARTRRIIARTQERMGIVVPRRKYRPLSLSDRELWARLRKDDNPRDLVEEAQQALRDGLPGTALKLGKDLWAAGGEHQTMYSYELLDAAYGALGRDVLRAVLREHRAHRDLPTVDILQAEAEAAGEED
jgi:hypothetical protein